MSINKTRKDHDEHVGAEEDKELATGNQLWRLNQLGLLEPYRLTFGDASRMVSEAKRNGQF